MMAKETDIPVGHIGRCIYDPSHPGPFTDEHILADGLGGEFMLTNASCLICQAKINTQIEQPIMMRMMKAIRYRRDIGTRGINKRPPNLPVFKPREVGNTASENLSDIADWERIDLPRKEHPSLLVLPVLNQPEFFRDFAPPSTKPWFQGMWQHIEPSPHRGADGVPIKTQTKFNVEVFCRLIAKTAHCAAVQKFGLDGFTPFLTDIILGNDLSKVSHLIGCRSVGEPPAASHYEIFFGQPRNPNLSKYILCSVRIFADLGAPSYLAVVGERRLQPENI
ncbi:MAG: hypothetical protein EOP49_53400 [Sphingobacteriales bacterium]|nr:MAG: hypothetical protein EOP49_53400 [Sphingobacteriales bacterium]